MAQKGNQFHIRPSINFMQQKCTCADMGIKSEECKFFPLCTSNSSSVNHPQHYGGDNVYEAIKVIEAWKADFLIGNTLKYISRAGKKEGATELQDLEKAAWYLQRRIDNIKNNK